MSSFLKILIAIVIIVAIVLLATNKKKTDTMNEDASTLSDGTTNEDLEGDLTSIDAQLDAVNQSSADVDAGLNDQPVAQE